MDWAGVGKVCLALPAATLDHPFGDDHDTDRVGGKMFAMVGGPGGVSFKSSDIACAVLTESGKAAPAPCLARARWVHLPIRRIGATMSSARIWRSPMQSSRSA
jgi:predicted DNA-binding protein (MmcQ/YjbR family)